MLFLVHGLEKEHSACDMDVDKISFPVGWIYPLSMDSEDSPLVDVSKKAVAKLHTINQFAFQCHKPLVLRIDPHLTRKPMKDACLVRRGIE